MNEKEMTALTTSVGAEVGQSSQTNHINSITQENEENKWEDDFSYDFRRELLLANDKSYLKTVTMFVSKKADTMFFVMCAFIPMISLNLTNLEITL